MSAVAPFAMTSERIVNFIVDWWWAWLILTWVGYSCHRWLEDLKKEQKETGHDALCFSITALLLVAGLTCSAIGITGTIVRLMP